MNDVDDLREHLIATQLAGPVGISLDGRQKTLRPSLFEPVTARTIQAV